MLSYTEKYRPRTLSDVIGQPCVTALRQFVVEPYSTCILLEGPTGTGKSATAKALANDLGCYGHPMFEPCYVEAAGNFKTEAVAYYFYSPDTPFRFAGLHVLILEELETMNPTVQLLMKDALGEGRLPRNVVVVATSNGVGKLPKAIRDRFALHHYCFQAGQPFADAVNERLAEIWQAEFGPGVDLPYGYDALGWEGDNFSARLALDRLQRYADVERRWAAEGKTHATV